MMPTLRVNHAAHAVLDIVRFDRLEPGPQPLTLQRVMAESLLVREDAIDAIDYLVETGRIHREDVTV
jgi:hypothetical protein